MYRILDRLYLSDFEDAMNAPEGMFIVNCTRNLPMVGRGIRLPVDDDLSQRAMRGMREYLPRVISAIDSVRTSGGSVLVHCRAGMQRSPAVIAAYLMHTQGMGRDEAIQFIRNRKPDAFLTGVNFKSVL
jgi:protein-tyrosine phosphatase